MLSPDSHIFDRACDRVLDAAVRKAIDGDVAAATRMLSGLRPEARDWMRGAVSVELDGEIAKPIRRRVLADVIAPLLN
jgi:hypothetical protein